MDRKTQRLCWSTSFAGIVLVLASALIAVTQPVAPVAAQAAASHGRTVHAAPPAFTFGTEGGNMIPLSVAIGADGTVTVQRLGKATATPLHLTRDALDGLRALAAVERFTALPNQMIHFGNPDVSGRFISMSTGSGVKTVHVRFVRSAPFDQLYAVLMAVAAPSLPGPHAA